MITNHRKLRCSIEIIFDIFAAIKLKKNKEEEKLFGTY